MTRVLMTTWRRQGHSLGPVLRDMVGAEVWYVQAIQRSGAGVYLLPRPDDEGDPAAALQGFDGLVLIGGEDLAADSSGVPPHEVGDNADAGRDCWEVALLRAALVADLPVLPICRGLQVLNVAFGGTLHGHISGSFADHPSVPDVLEEALAHRHDVHLDSGSRIAEILGSTCVATNSLHHQAVDTVGDGLVVTGRTIDGVVEVVEKPDARWCVAVQWHPELMPSNTVQQRLVDSFVSACRTTAAVV